MKKNKLVLFILMTILMLIKLGNPSILEAAGDGESEEKISISDKFLFVENNELNYLATENHVEDESSYILDNEEPLEIDSTKSASFKQVFEEKIILNDSEALFLGNDGEFLIKNTIEAEINPTDWDNPDGYFNHLTKVEGSGTFHIKSTEAVQIGKIRNYDELGAIHIHEGSHILIDITEEIAADELDQETWPAGIESNRVYVNEENESHTIVNIKSKYIGIFSEELYVNNSTINVASDAYGLYLGKSKSDSLLTYNGKIMLENSNVNIDIKENILPTVAGSELLDENGLLTGKIIIGSTGIMASYIQVLASQINITSEGHGIIYGSSIQCQSTGVGTENMIKSKIHVEAIHGLGIFSQYKDDYQTYLNTGNISIMDSDIFSSTENGSAAIAGESIYSFTEGIQEKNKIYAKAKNSFAILVQNLTYMQQFPSGNFHSDNTIIEAYVEDGMAISTNMASFNNTDVMATADKGIAISVCMLNANQNIEDETNIMLLESKGSTQRHFQVYDSIPDSAGISTLSSLNIYGAYKVDIKTELDNPDAYGIHSALFDQEGFISGGGLSIQNLSNGSMEFNIEAATGIFSPYSMYMYNDMSSLALNIHATKVGIETESLNINGSNMVNINILAKEGVGFQTYKKSRYSNHNFHINNLNLNIEAGECGIDLSSLESGLYISLRESNINTKATGEDSVGIILEDVNKDYSSIEILNTNISAIGKKHGIYVKDALQIKFLGENSNNTISSTADTEAFKMDAGELLFETDDLSHLIFTNKALLSQADLTSYKPAINMYDSSKLTVAGTGKVDIIEEYETKISKSITSSPYMAYSADKNIINPTLYDWEMDSTPLEISESGIYTNDLIAGNFTVTGKRIGQEDVFSLPDNASHQIVLQTDVNVFTVSFDSSGGTAVESGKNSAGSLLIKPADPLKSGYLFSHWVDKSSGEIWEYNTDMMPFYDLSLEAVWKKALFMVHFNGNTLGGRVENMPADFQAIFDDIISKPVKNPTRQSYEFLGWYTESATSKKWDFSKDKMPPSDLHLYAKWNSVISGGTVIAIDEKDKLNKKYTLTYKANGGIGADNIKSDVVYKTVVSIQDNIFTSQKNKVFYGWSTKADGSGRIYMRNDSMLMLDDTILYAVWKDRDKPMLQKDDHISYIQGYPNERFEANKPITRAEVAMIFFRLSDDINKENITARAITNDVDPQKWYAQAVTYLYDNEIIEGYPDKSFRPEKAISRAEIAMIAYKFDSLALGHETSKFSDVSQAHWAYDYILSAESKGWIQGYGDNTFRPDNMITRGELVVFINQVLNRSADLSGLIPGYIKFDDIQENHFAYHEILEASNSHLYKREDDGKEIWTEIYE